MAEALAHDDRFVSRFREIPEPLAQSGPLWLRRLRESSLKLFVERGLPTIRMESWRQTNLAPLDRIAFGHSTDSSTEDSLNRLSASPFLELELDRIVLVDGLHSPRLSSLAGLPDGVTAGSLSQLLREQPERVEPHLARLAKPEQRSLTALNTASFVDGAVILVDDGVVVDRPLQIVHLVGQRSEPFAIFPRTLIAVGEQSSLSVIETYLGPPETVYLTNTVSEIAVGQNSSVEHVRLQDEGRDGYHIGDLQAQLQRDSRYRCHNVTLGACLTRNDIGARLSGEGAEAVLNGLFVGRGSQHIDNHTLLDHEQPHCPSHELYKGILADRARGVFNGRIVVHKDAQKTNAIQSNKNLLLSGDAAVHTRPQLEIYADDVRCTHGATIGQLDADALFYLRTRGLDKQAARRLMIKAFASELVHEIPHELLRSRLSETIIDRLPAG